MAAKERNKSGAAFIAVTGSNGKTTVKEMLKSILLPLNSVLATEGNLNNHIGVPLTLLRLKEEHKFAVIEMGASARGEIRHLCQIAKPDVAILNNAGAAHLEGFGSLQGVAEAKGEIISGLSETGTAVLNQEDPWFSYWLELAGKRPVLSFGWTNKADVWVDVESISSSLKGCQFETTFTLHYQQDSVSITLNLVGRHNVLNAMAASAAALSTGVSLKKIAQGLKNLQPVKGRMQPLLGQNQSVIIHDGYNANPKSFEEALNCVLPLNKQVFLVLGDFAELGEESTLIHQQLGARIAESSVTRLFAIGEAMRHAVEAVKASSESVQAEHFSSKEALIEALNVALSQDVLVLVKGSRSQGLESVVEKIINQESSPCC
jgi:UDP-N-acetylmuramoyl-tripeptide--D-alanyl-D-alanine ligase